MSKTILAEMKKGELDAFTLFALQDDIRNAIGKPQMKQAEVKQPKVKQPEPKKQTSGKRRDLTKEEIISVAIKYGYSTNDNHLRRSYHIPDNPRIEIYVSYASPWFYWVGQAFCSNGIYTTHVFGLTASKQDFISYSELRNNPKMTYTYLNERFSVHGEKFLEKAREKPQML